MSYTKGPWKITNDTYGPKKYPELNIRTEQNSYVCTIPEQNQVNAQLISAAPDMLEALEAVVDSMTFGKPVNTFSTKVLEAIRKARGF